MPNFNDSGCRQLHRALAAELNEVPDYLHAANALGAIQQQRRAGSHDDAGDTLDQVADDLAAEARAGEPVDVDAAITRITDIERRAAARGALASTLVIAERTLLSEADAVARRAMPTIVKRLNDRLRTALDDLAAIERPSELTDADRAISLGRADDYATAQRLRATYLEIRSKQATVCETSGAGATQHAAAMHLRGQESLMPRGQWATAQRGQTWRNEDGELCQPDPMPWPISDAQSLAHALTDPRWLDWLLAHPAARARAWVPTSAELTAETNRLDDVLAAADPPTVLSPHTRHANV